MRCNSRRGYATQALIEPLEPRQLMSTWYVRPWQSGNAKYGAGTGASYADAWAGFTNVVWGAGGVTAGDTLYVCGTHPDPKDNLAGQALNNRDTQLNVLASGAEGAPITIRGDYAGDAGRIIRSTYQWTFDIANLTATGWTGPDAYGVYTHGNNYSSVSNPIEMDVATGAIYQLKLATAAPSADPSQWTSAGTACIIGDTYYLKPRFATTKSIVYTAYAIGVKIQNQDYITVTNLSVYGGATSSGLVSVYDDSDYITLDHLTIKYSGYNGIDIGISSGSTTPGNDYGQIAYCYIEGFLSGIHTISGAYKSTDWWIHHNTIVNGYQDARANNDACGIWLEAGSNHLVEYNIVKHVAAVGIGMDLKEGSSDPNLRGICNNDIFRYNWVEDTADYTHSRYDAGTFWVSTTAANHNPDHSLNDQAYYNVFLGGEHYGMTNSAAEPTPGLGDHWLMANNLVLDSGDSGTAGAKAGFTFASNTSTNGPAGFTFVNQIIGDSHTTHIWISTDQGTVGLDSVTIDYNLYDSDGYHKWYGGYYPLSSPISHWYDTLAAWQAGQHRDTHSPASGDPRFVDKSGQDYRLQWNSPAIDAGTQWWTADMVKDRAGNNIDLTDYDGMPIYGTPDIGPFEYQPPYMMGIDTIAANSTVRIYGDGKFRQLTSAGATAASLAVAPAAGWGTFTNTQQRPAWMDLAVSTWLTTGTYTRVWTETGGTLGSTPTAHVIGGLSPNTNYNLAVNGVWGSGVSGAGMAGGLVRSDASGQISFTYTGGYVSAPTFALAKAVWGDFNNDGLVNAADIDAMMAEIRNTGNRSPFDLTLDAQVTQADADNLVQTVLHTIYGDADLNGMVDQRDYAAWFNHNGLSAGWADGNFTSDTVVDQRDYAQWYNHNGLSGQTAPLATPLPSLAISSTATADGLQGLMDIPATKLVKVSWPASVDEADTELLDVLALPALAPAVS